MARFTRSSRFSSRRPAKRRGLTAAQQAAHEKAYDACDHTVLGRFSKGDVIIAGHDDAAWKIATYGIAYHEDCSDRIYGVQPTRGPKGWKETCELRAAISHVLHCGTHEIGSRGGYDRGEDGQWISRQQPRPEGAEVATWRDGRPNSYASYPTLTMYEGGVVGVRSPNYDDSPSVAWIADAKLAKRMAKAIVTCPRPINLPEASVIEREVNVTIEPSSPRYAAYAAARGVGRYTKLDYTTHPSTEIVIGLTLPRSEHRRIKAELDAADAETQEEV